MPLSLVTAGESHGPALVAIVTGLPAGLVLDKAAIDSDLHRRQQGYGRSPRQQIEQDEVEVLAGLRQGRTLGTPLAPGASSMVQFMLGIQTTGTFRFLIIVEALP